MVGHRMDGWVAGFMGKFPDSRTNSGPLCTIVFSFSNLLFIVQEFFNFNSFISFLPSFLDDEGERERPKRVNKRGQ